VGSENYLYQLLGESRSPDWAGAFPPAAEPWPASLFSVARSPFGSEIPL